MTDENRINFVCIKCGHPEVKVQYRHAKRKGKPEEECLSIECLRCGYLCARPCVDADNKPAPKQESGE